MSSFTSMDSLRIRALFNHGVEYFNRHPFDMALHIKLKNGPVVRISERQILYRANFASYFERRMWAEWLGKIKDMPEDMTVSPDWLDDGSVKATTEAPEVSMIDVLMEQG